MLTRRDSVLVTNLGVWHIKITYLCLQLLCKCSILLIYAVGLHVAVGEVRTPGSRETNDNTNHETLCLFYNKVHLPLCYQRCEACTNALSCAASNDFRGATYGGKLGTGAERIIGPERAFYAH